MANSVLPVQLNKGLDLVSPPLLAEQGALIDCLNYEMTDIAGYRRIDGYERYDGYQNGAVYQYFTATLVATVGGNQSLIVAGSTVSRNVPLPPGVTTETASTDEVGVIVGAGTGANNYAYVPESGAGVLIAGQTVVIQPPTGSSFTATVTVGSINGKISAPNVATYLANLRNYSAILRALVTAAPGAIAGLWWLNNNLYGAVAAKVLDYVNSPAVGPYPVPGALIQHKGIIYQLVGYQDYDTGTSPTPGAVKLVLIPKGTATVTSDSVVEVDTGYTPLVTYGTAATAAITPEYGTSCYVVRFNEPSSSTARGYTALNIVVRIPFDGGTYPTEDVPVDVPTTVTNNSNSINTGILRYVNKVSGSFVAGTAAGFMHVELNYGGAGRTSMRDNFDITTADGFTVLAKTNALNPHNDIVGPVAPGAYVLNSSGTRYTYVVSNFYGDLSYRSCYITTGASRAIFCDARSWGNIFTQESDALDIPKYVAYHMGRLALGFSGGSIQRSVVGEPFNFSGVDGADEITTGDSLTGLLEMPDDSLVAFGRRTIRRITGSDDVTTQLTNVSSNAGCFDYTAVLVGQNAVFTGVNGVTSLDQTAAYGDFAGSRTSDSVSSWLRPKLLVDAAGFETGGVLMAYPVRSKNQYRLILQDGNVLTLTLTSEGPRSTLQRWGLDNDLRVPLAVSSEVSDVGKERIHVAWDKYRASRGVLGVVGNLPDNTRVYEMDSGWGFDGKYFPHYFDTAHLFSNGSANYMGIEKIRLYGKGYGVATLNVKSSGIEDDFDQAYHSAIQDISMPATPTVFYDQMMPITTIIDQANWGLGIKLRIQNTTASGSSNTEPSHICQVLVLHLRTEGATD